MRKIVHVVIAGLLTLTACGTAEVNSASPFESHEELIEAINSHADLRCSPELVEIQNESDAEGSWDSMRCDDGSLAHYLHDDDAKAYLLDALKQEDMSRKRVAIGDDWIFVGQDHTAAHAVRKALSGVQPAFSSSPPSSAQEPSAESSPEEDVPERAFEDDIELSGTGDDIVELDIPEDEPAIAHITHDGTSNFQVKGYTSDGERTGSLVNEIGHYDGTRPVNFQEPVAKELDIVADGNWTVTIQPILEAELAQTSGVTEGMGDAVVLVAHLGASSVEVSHEGESNFQVRAWGSSRTGMINEIGAYDGRVRMPTDAQLLEIVADGGWSFNFD